MLCTINHLNPFSPRWFQLGLCPDWNKFPGSLLCRFFTFMLILFCLHTMGLGMFRFVASLARNENIAATAGSLYFLLLLLLGGFLLQRSAY